MTLKLIIALMRGVWLKTVLWECKLKYKDVLRISLV